jgi:hypothetical protein
MGTEKKCSLFRSPEIVNMGRESAIMTSTAAQPVKKILGFVIDLILKVILPRNIRRMR